MKRSILSLIVLSMLCGTVWTTVGTAAERALPRDFKEFKTRYQQEGRSMEGAAHLYFEAVFSYLDAGTRSEASKMLRYAMYLPQPIERLNNYATFVERMKNPNYHHIFRSFAIGTSPENNYQMSPENFKLAIESKKKEADFTYLYLRSSGADSPRGVWMQEHDGLWYMINNAATYVTVRDPIAVVEAKRNAHDADYDEPEEEPVVDAQGGARDAAYDGSSNNPNYEYESTYDDTPYNPDDAGY